MKNIYLYNRATDEEIEIKHKNAFTLDGGFYVVQDFKTIGKSEKSIRKALAEGKSVYSLDGYAGNSEPFGPMFFTGKVIWSNTKLYEGCTGGGLKVGNVPAGTLVVGLSDD